MFAEIRRSCVLYAVNIVSRIPYRCCMSAHTQTALQHSAASSLSPSPVFIHSLVMFCSVVVPLFAIFFRRIAPLDCHYFSHHTISVIFSLHDRAPFAMFYDDYRSQHVKIMHYVATVEIRWLKMTVINLLVKWMMMHINDCTTVVLVFVISPADAVLQSALHDSWFCIQYISVRLCCMCIIPGAPWMIQAYFGLVF